VNNQQLLKSSIETIKQLREELHDDIDSSRREKLDQVIEDLERCDAQKITAVQILDLFGKAINALPCIEKILEFLK
jgi:hypothetical protein